MYEKIDLTIIDSIQLKQLAWRWDVRLISHYLAKHDQQQPGKHRSGNSRRIQTQAPCRKLMWRKDYFDLESLPVPVKSLPWRKSAWKSRTVGRAPSRNTTHANKPAASPATMTKIAIRGNCGLVVGSVMVGPDQLGWFARISGANIVPPVAL